MTEEEAPLGGISRSLLGGFGGPWQWLSCHAKQKQITAGVAERILDVGIRGYQKYWDFSVLGYFEVPLNPEQRW